MKIFEWSFSENFELNEEITIVLGTFETLHLGHYELIKIAQDLKNTYPQQKLAIMLFSNSYKNLFNNEKKALQTKIRLFTLFNLSFDYVFLVDINKDKLATSHADFVQNLKLNGIKNVVCGPDFKFGFRKLGDIDYLKKYFNVYVANERKIQKQKISTSLIRELIMEGKINAINNLMIEKYAFITNLEKFKFKFPNNLLKLKSGIYIVNCVIADIEYHGLIKIGNNLEDEMDNEIYLFDLQLIPSKYEEVFIELEEAIRFINFNHENMITEFDIEVTKKWFLK
ncbi:Riboflavin biosynthesis protein [Metamycoplasma auris 15026]|uniref:FAD synthase n=1 Tax=Metamycoplasma auris 15026 TaxID=1188233 RepID=N9TQR1_9BACT|nr:riboflavin biosynthesis protein [Metamycoplasma auris]ENY68489.1 Riboflavin biosynthesis protein [Metamycoplasma auris 15026]